MAAKDTTRTRPPIAATTRDTLSCIAHAVVARKMSEVNGAEGFYDYWFNSLTAQDKRLIKFFGDEVTRVSQALAQGLDQEQVEA